MSYYLKASIFLSILIAVAYLPSLGGDWIGDDWVLVVNTQCGRSLENVFNIFSGNAGPCNYRPFRYLSYFIDHSIWGLNPFGYRLSNLLLHVAASTLVLLFLNRLGLSRAAAVFGAIIFAIHPVHVDSVGYISGRRDLLMGLFYLLSIVLFYQAFNNQNSTRWHIYILYSLATISALLSIAAKEMGVTIIAMIILVIAFGGHLHMPYPDKTPKPNKVPKKHLRLILLALLPLGLITIIVIIKQGIINPNSTMIGMLYGDSIPAHIATVLGTHARYIEMLFFPLRLLGDYSPPAIAIRTTFFNAATFIGIVWLLGLCLLALYFYRRNYRREAYGLLWYLITMLPVSHIIPHHEIAAEHYLYIPIVGLIITIAGLCDRHHKAIPRYIQQRLLFVLISVMMLLFIRTLFRSIDYRGELEHTAATLNWEPLSVRANARRAVYLVLFDEFERAKPHLEYVLSTDFQSSSRLKVLESLGHYYTYTKQFHLAIKPLEELLQSQPNKIPSVQALASAYYHTGQLEQANQQHLRLVALRPNNPTFRYLAGLTLFHLGQNEEASLQLTKALEIDPEHVNSLLLYANLLHKTDRETAQEMLLKAKVLVNNISENSVLSTDEYKNQRALVEKMLVDFAGKDTDTDEVLPNHETNAVE